jgi:hypothetical protein
MASAQHKLDLAMLSSILKEPNLHPSALLDWYRSACEKASDMARNRIFNILLEGLEGLGLGVGLRLGLVEEFLELGGFRDRIPDRETGILYIRYYLIHDMLYEACVMFESMPPEMTRKKHASLIMQYMLRHSQYEDACRYYHTYILPRYRVDGSDIAGFLHKDISSSLRNGVLETVLGQPLTLPHCIGIESTVTVTENGVLPGDLGTLELLDFNSTQINELVANLHKAFKLQCKEPVLDLSHEYDYVIDGANLLFYIDRKICLRGYQRITKMIKALQVHKPVAKILLVLHTRHFKPNPSKWSRKAHDHITEWGMIENLDICRTPWHFNDDYYSLLNAIPRKKCFLITNDKFRDHIFMLSSKEHNLDLIAQWRHEKVIEYDYEHGQVVLLEPPIYSFRVQRVKNVYYLPIKCEDDGSRAIWTHVPCS